MLFQLLGKATFVKYAFSETGIGGGGAAWGGAGRKTTGRGHTKAAVQHLVCV